MLSNVFVLKIRSGIKMFLNKVYFTGHNSSKQIFDCVVLQCHSIWMLVLCELL